jgi:hypothetical protein
VVVATGRLFTPVRVSGEAASDKPVSPLANACIPALVAAMSDVTLDDLWCVRVPSRGDELLNVFAVLKARDAVFLYSPDSERVIATRCADRLVVSNRADNRCVVSDPLWRLLATERPASKRNRVEATGLQAIAGHVDCCGFAGRTPTSALSPDPAFVTLVADYMRDKSPDQILANLCPGCVKAFAVLGSTLHIAPL